MPRQISPGKTVWVRVQEGVLEEGLYAQIVISSTTSTSQLNGL